MVCDRGSVRPENQDATLLRLPERVVQLPSAEPTERPQGGRSVLSFTAEDNGAPSGRPSDLLALVADGMGGPPGGAQASQIIARTVEEVLAHVQEFEPPVFMHGLVERCNQSILREAHARGLIGMGSTLTLVALSGAQAHLCHIGDSRCYRIRPGEGKLEQWSRDQNVASQLVEEGVLSVEEARNHPSSHALTQAVGLGKPLVPQLDSVPLSSGEEIFMLCSDGLLRVVEDVEILAAFTRQRPADSGESASLQAAAEHLLDLANRRGSPDNVTILALRLQPRDEG